MNRNFVIAIVAALLAAAGAGFALSRHKPKPPADTPTVLASDQTAQRLYEQAKQLRQENNIEGAKKIYQDILEKSPDYAQAETVQRDLEEVNMAAILQNRPSPYAAMHDVQPGDTLGALAKKYGTTVDLIKKMNNLSGNVIRVGQKLRVWTGAFHIFVDKSQNILRLLVGDEVFKTYRVSTGANNSTPVGEFTIINKLENPVWFNKGIVVPPESPANVLGARWLGFNIDGYGIHGTVEPDKIGQQVTAGCVRMRNEDVTELYTLIPTGTKVKIQD
ncbi:MAG: L,D-transpeptidase family protein [Candidatus Omnitrophica bacterium]|nr:L,D-transpeptidase family protein [Candidatus Omnitrophota bacterium]